MRFRGQSSRTNADNGIKPEVQAIIDRHARIDWHNPRHDPERATAAFERYLRELNLKRAVRWIADPAEVWAAIKDGWDPARANEQLAQLRLMYLLSEWAWRPGRQRAASDAWDGAVAAKSAGARVMFATATGDPMLRHGVERVALLAMVDALNVGRAIGWLNVDTGRVDSRLSSTVFRVGEKYVRAPTARRLIEVFEPIIDALDAGAFGHLIGKKEVLVFACPSLHVRVDTLHREDGPAVGWPRTKLWYWNGINLPRRVVERPETLDVSEILQQPNVEIRRVMIERFGPGRYVQEIGGREVNRDAAGTLWHCPMGDGSEVFAVVEVVNGSKEPDGTRKRYFLSVPPEFRSAMAAVAWTYGMTVRQYRQLKVRT